MELAGILNVWTRIHVSRIQISDVSLLRSRVEILMDKYIITSCRVHLNSFAHITSLFLQFAERGTSSRSSWCTLQAIRNCAGRRCIADDPMGTSSFIIPARLYNAWEILTVITAASQGFLPRPTGFRDSANYGSGMDLQCLIYYSDWAGLKAPPENYWRIKRTGWCGIGTCDFVTH